MIKMILATTALVLVTTPAHAQLLGGGGGLGGMVGGTLGGAGSIGLPSPPSMPSTETVRGATRGTVEASGNASGVAKADRRSGRVDGAGQGSGSIAGNLSNTASVPLGSANTSGSARGSVSGNGSASVQLIGTDAVRSAAESLVGQARTTGQAAAQDGRGTVESVAGLAGQLSAGAQAAGSSNGGAASSGIGSLVLAGSLAAQAQGAFVIQKGTPIFASDGDRIGTVAQVVSDARGQVRQVLVNVDGTRALLPAEAFQVRGEALVSAMGEGQIKQITDQQEQAQ